MIANIALLPAYATGSALVPVVSAVYGKGNVPRMREAYRYYIIFSGWMVFLLTAPLFIVPDPSLYPFTYSDSTQCFKKGMTEALRICSLCIPFYCIILLESSMFPTMVLPNSGPWAWRWSGT